MSVLESYLNGAKVPIFKCKIKLAAPDCGGEDYDEIEYAPFCPKCDYEFEDFSHYNFCPNCGTKMWWGVTYPDINMKEG